MLRGVACLLLSAIALDLAVDAACDPISLGALSASTNEVRGSAPNEPAEPCADFCLEDCFCCSRSVAAGPALLPPEPQTPTAVAAPASDGQSEGVHPIIDRPPLTRA